MVCVILHEGKVISISNFSTASNLTFLGEPFVSEDLSRRHFLALTLGLLILSVAAYFCGFQHQGLPVNLANRALD